MFNHGKIILLSGLLIPGIAMAQINVGDSLGTTEQAIRTELEAQGYTISEIEVEGDEIEVEATLDGQAFEFEISTKTGSVTEVELEEDDDAEDS